MVPYLWSQPFFPPLKLLHVHRLVDHQACHSPRWNPRKLSWLVVRFLRPGSHPTLQPPELVNIHGQQTVGRTPIRPKSRQVSRELGKQLL